MSMRGMLNAANRLEGCLNNILRHSPVDDIRVPKGTQLNEMCWQFDGDLEPTPVDDCKREGLLIIVKALADEVSKLREALEDRSLQNIAKAYPEKIEALNEQINP